MGIAEQARGLTLDGDGIWTNTRAARRGPGAEALRYPEAGNRRCYQLEDESYWFKHRNACIVAIVKRFPPAGPILDIGGGNGFVTRRLLDEGFDAALLEPGHEGAWNAKKARHIPEVICCTLQGARLPPEALDAAGCFDVLEHLPNVRGFLRHLHTRLKPGGLLYATVPAHDWLWSASDEHAQHQTRYDRRTIARLLAELGYEQLHFSYFFQVLTLPVLLMRALPFRLGLGGAGVLSDQAEHGTSGGAAVAVLERLLRREAGQIARGSALRVGTSCLFVARKPCP